MNKKSHNKASNRMSGLRPQPFKCVVMWTPALGCLGIIFKSTVINLNYGVTNV